MNASTWMLTITLAVGLLVSSTAALCSSPAEDATMPAQSAAHSHKHPHSHAHSHHDQQSYPTSRSNGSDASTGDMCHHTQTPPMLTSIEGPSCDLCTGFPHASDPLLTVRDLSISPVNAHGPPLYDAPLDRPPALPA